MGKCFFIRTSPVVVFPYFSILTLAYSLHAFHTFPYSHLPTHCMLACSLHACILIACLHTHHLHILTLAYFDTCILCTWMLSLFHLHWGTYSVHVVVQVWWKCQCVSEVSKCECSRAFPEEPFAMLSGKTRHISFVERFGTRLLGRTDLLNDTSRKVLGPRD